ncbi:hypothetical protein F7734_02760 [Scytonema sp. UIC 10036]|uniref:hypothetical protein n=1 Tax=Scytonema sp. UIC 10036 TaxID=2304196 RepID=UPI0012DA3DBA|nr:hypothetical protein [Scytonema sp. UIC 10036]MUG91464.1 hypothetical protein [Scytonema sp. UIC 10036]
MTTNLVKNISRPGDLEPLVEIISGLIGETCWKASLSYGDELTLHIGERIPYSQKAMRRKEKGAWILGTQATQWQIDSPSETIVTSSDDSEIIKQRLDTIANNAIAAVEINYQNLGLSITFNNKYKLILLPNNEDNEEDIDLPYWEIFTPYQMVLKVGSGSKWSYTSSHSRSLAL